MMLLSDGSVMVHGGAGNASSAFYRLTPNSRGSYVHSTWSIMPRMKLARLFYSSVVMPSGDVLILGGEYSGQNTKPTEVDSGQIYDPVAKKWTRIMPFPQKTLGDAPTEVLPGGSVLAGSQNDAATYIYHPSSNTWTQTGSKLRGDWSSEESWVKLPDGSILSYDLNSSIVSQTATAQRYIPSTGRWGSAGTLPALLSSPRQSYELGAGILLPDGRAFFLGANGQTAFYSSPTPTNPTGSWASGPVLPHHLAAGDAPAAMLPNGDVLMALSPKIRTSRKHPNNSIYPRPARIFEYNPLSNHFTDVTPPRFGLRLTHSYVTSMLVLPTGQVLLSDDRGRIAVYKPGGSPDPSWRPTIRQIARSSSRNYILFGTQLNGLSEGAAYGDDNEMASNFPIVRLTDSANRVSYARTSYWSSTLVATGSSPEGVLFTMPAHDPPGEYSISVIANGIASAPDPMLLG